MKSKIKKYILEKNNTQLNELVATKDKFFSIIAHDLKSPFNSILGFLEIMERNYDTQDDKTRKEMLNNALNSSKAIYELTDNLLFWARVENGSLKLTMKSINLIELLKTNVKVASILSKEKNITIDLKNSEELITMDGDVNMLNFVLRNLLSNSIKFTPNKGLIEVSVKQSENEIEFCVRDTGVGIPEDMIENLFKIDKAFTTPGTNKEKGTGLGLILCHDFIARHNGAIRVESKLNAGSSFYVLLPRYQKIKDKTNE
jgi:signal transduction histidine kinase